MTNSASWVILDASGTTVYTPPSAGGTVTAIPGATASWAWSQLDSSGQQVPAGTYTFQITTSVGIFNATFTIVGGTTSGLAYTNLPQYAVGATVTLGFRNTGSTTITLANSAPWFILNALGAPVYSPIYLTVLVNVPPGTSATWTWNQKNNAGVQVAAGTYTFQITTSVGIFTATFSIGAGTGKTQLTLNASTQDMPSLIFVNNSVFQGYFLAYQSWETGTANNGDIFVEKYDTNWNLKARVQATSLPSYQDSPSLAVVSIGTGYYLELAYTSSEIGGYWHIFAQTFDLNLNYIANSKTQLTSSSTEDLPSIIFDGSSSIYIAYQSWQAGSSFQGDIYIEKLNLNLVSSSKVRVTYENSYQDCPSLLYNPETGIIYVAYVSNATGNLDIFLQRYTSSLGYLNTYQLTTNSTDQYRPSLAPTYVSTYPSIQGLQMAYQSNETGTSNQRDIFVEDFDLNLNTLKKTQITNDQFYSATPSIVPSLVPLGVSWCPGYVAYVSSENGNWDIWLQQLTVTPPPAYSVTIAAYCNTLGVSVAVAITQGGLPSGFSTPCTFSGLTGSQTFTVPGTDGHGHAFKKWSTGSTSLTITVSSGGTYTAYYEQPTPPPTYSATVTAYCYTQGVNVSVAITQGGLPSGFSTPHTFTGLTGSQTFTVPGTDGHGHAFKKWSTGSTSLTITVSSGGTYTAYYGDVQGPVVYVSPNSSVALVSRNVTVAVNVANVTNLYSWQIKLYFNTSSVNCTGASYPDYHIFAGMSFIPVTPIIEQNYIVFGASLIGGGRFDGSGTLCLINFTGLKEGACPLQFDATETFLLDSDLNTMATTRSPGLITVVLTSPLTGDITGPNGAPDGTVNMYDIGLIGKYWLQNVPPAPSICDIVPDGRIDMKDIGLVCRHFMEHYP
jgi:hypothetical protein